MINLQFRYYITRKQSRQPSAFYDLMDPCFSILAQIGVADLATRDTQRLPHILFDVFMVSFHYLHCSKEYLWGFTTRCFVTGRLSLSLSSQSIKNSRTSSKKAKIRKQLVHKLAPFALSL